MLRNVCSIRTGWCSWVCCFKAVLEVEEPKSASDVRSFLDLANYSSRFIPHFATLSEPPRRLKETPFEFGLEQKKSFECLKQKTAEACTLAYFDKNAPTKIITDANPVGLGAVLVQEDSCLLYTSPSPRDGLLSRMPSSA